MALVLQKNLLALAARVRKHLPSLAELTRAMSSDALRDGSRYL